MKITLLYSIATRRAIAAPYADTEEDTQESAMEVAQALRDKGAAVTVQGVDEDHIGRIARVQADLVFNLIEWTGLDLPLADRAFAQIERLGVPYTGATRANYLATSDKIPMKTALEDAGLPTAKFQVFTRGDERVRSDFRYPVIIKPALEHCSIGLTKDAIVHKPSDLSARVSERIKRFAESMIVEEFIEGREFQVTVLETSAGLLVLPPAEIVYTKWGGVQLLTFDSRWDAATDEYQSSHVALAQLSTALERSISTIAKDTFRKLSFRDYSRLDVRCRGEDVYILEANSNPGLSDDAEYGMTVSYRALGWEFADFIWAIVSSALRRPAR